MLTFKERIQKYEYHLNDTDDQIISYINDHFTNVTRMSIQAIAEESFTVPNTIVRLAKKLGYDGFSHMKNAIKHELEANEEDVPDDVLKKTKELIDEVHVEQVHHLLEQARRVLVYGIGDSVTYCEYLVQGYRVVNKKCEFYLHRHTTITELEAMTPKDLLLLISVSGESEAVIELAGRAKEKNIPIVSITHFTHNSLVNYADYRLYFYSPPERLLHHNITNPTPIFYLLRHLLEQYWKNHK